MTSNNSTVGNSTVNNSNASNAKPALTNVPIYTYEIVNTYKHDPKAFTQGLVFHNGFLYESTGEYEESTLRKVELQTGKILQKKDLADDYFAEGMTILNGKIYQITWQENTAFVYDANDLTLLREVKYQGSGWGLTNDGANLILSEVFEYGFYHADPHPGNFLVLESGAIGALDFGMVGRIGDALRLDLLDLMAAVVAQDAARAVDAFEALGVAGVGANRSALERDLGHFLERYLGRPLSEVRVADLSEELFTIVRRHRLRMPAELVLMLKTLAMNEGVGRHLDPDFNASAVAAPFVRQAMRRRLRPSAWEPELRRGLTDLARMGLDLPGQVRRLTRRLDRGELTVRFRPDEIDEPLRRLDAMVNRLALAVLVAAFVIAIGLAMVFYHPGEDATWLAWFFGLGLAALVALGVWLALAVRRSGRR